VNQFTGSRGTGRIEVGGGGASRAAGRCRYNPEGVSLVLSTELDSGVVEPGGPPRPGRRRVLQYAGGAVVAALGGYYGLAGRGADEAARRQLRPDGRSRLPPGQHLIRWLRPMGGLPGDPSPGQFRLTVTGEVRRPLEFTFRELLALPQTEQVCDVHCVTRWSVFDTAWVGVPVARLAEMAGVKSSARHVVFEAAYGYTANVPLEAALAPNVLVAHTLQGEPLPEANGPPARALVPDLYFWKSAKWLTGIRFTRADEPGYWETRGYHNQADPWLEERYG
jgi:DMSO/TMAO reductase YedYZ molybdopterin-dependent catalytic subunit